MPTPLADFLATLSPSQRKAFLHMRVEDFDRREVLRTALRTLTRAPDMNVDDVMDALDAYVDGRIDRAIRPAD